MNPDQTHVGLRDAKGTIFPGLHIPRFSQGGEPRIGSASAMNTLVDALNALGSMGIVRSDSDKVIITDANTILQVKRDDKDLAPIKAGVGRLKLYIDAALVIDIEDDTGQSACDTGMLQMNNFSSVPDIDNYDIDEFGLCLTHAATASEITAAYNSGSGQTWPAINGSVSSLSYYWTLNEVGTGSTKLDSIASLTWDPTATTPAVPALYSNGTKLESASPGMGLNGPNHTQLGYPGTGDGMCFFFWLRVNTNAANSVTQTNWFLQQFDSVGSQTDTLSLNFISKNGTIAIEHSSDIGPGASAFVSFAPAISSWHFICAVWEKP